MKVGENIQNHLRVRKWSISDLVAKTGIKRDDIKSLLYNRSRKAENLKAVASALGIPLSDLMPTTMQLPFQYKMYTLVVNIVCKNFDYFNIATNKEIFNEYVARIYNYIAENKDIGEKELLRYCEGMLKSAIAIGTVQKNP